MTTLLLTGGGKSRANAAPSASGQSPTATEDTAKVITLSGSDPDLNLLTFTIVSGPSHGTLGSIGSVSQVGDTCTADVTYTPAANYNGADSFTFKVTDTSLVDSDPATVSLTVNAVNDAPTMSTASINLTGTNEDTTSAGDTVQTVCNATDMADAADSNSLGIAITSTDSSLGTWQYSTDSGGSWTPFAASTGSSLLLTKATSNKIRFVPTANLNGTATLTFRAWDQSAGSNASTANTTSTGGSTAFSSGSCTASLAIAAVNDAPVLAAIEGTTLAYTENDAATVISATITASDVDSANLASATVSITGNFQSGQDVLSFVNANGITGSYSAGTGVMSLSGSSSVANYQAALRTVKYANSSDNPSTSTRTVSFTVNDGSLASNTVTRNISVAAVNDPPGGSFSAGSDFSMGSDQQTTISGSVAATDPDGDPITYAWTLVTGPTNGVPVFDDATLLHPSVTFVDSVSGGSLSGTYTLRLTATDSHAATATDDVVVTVNWSPVQLPGIQFFLTPHRGPALWQEKATDTPQLTGAIANSDPVGLAYDHINGLAARAAMPVLANQPTLAISGGKASFHFDGAQMLNVDNSKRIFADTYVKSGADHSGPLIYSWHVKFSVDSAVRATRMTLFGNAIFSATSIGFQIAVETNGDITVAAMKGAGGSVYSQVTIPAAVADTNDHHIDVRSDGTNLTAYFDNGSPVSAVVDHDLFTGNSNDGDSTYLLNIGRNPDASEFLIGKIKLIAFGAGVAWGATERTSLFNYAPDFSATVGFNRVLATGTSLAPNQLAGLYCEQSFQDPAQLFQDSLGTLAVVPGDPIGMMLAKNNLRLERGAVASADAKRPVYQADGTALFDGVDDHLPFKNIAWPGGADSVTVVVARHRSSLHGDTTNGSVLLAQIDTSNTLRITAKDNTDNLGTPKIPFALFKSNLGDQIKAEIGDRNEALIAIVVLRYGSQVGRVWVDSPVGTGNPTIGASAPTSDLWDPSQIGIDSSVIAGWEIDGEVAANIHYICQHTTADLLKLLRGVRNKPPVVSAGSDHAATTGVAYSLSDATATDPESAAMTYAWTKVSGSGTATFSNAAILNPTVTLSAADTYVLKLSVSDGRNTAFDFVTITVSDPLLGDQVDLSSYYNYEGITTDASPDVSSGDGLNYEGLSPGCSMSRDLLGATLNWSSATFTIGAAGGSNLVQCVAGPVVVNLPNAQYSSLKMLAIVDNDTPQASQNFVVTYQDNSTDTFTRDMSTWGAPQEYSGESHALDMAYINIGGSPEYPNTLYGYSFAVNPAKALKTITLPANDTIKLVALTALA